MYNRLNDESATRLHTSGTQAVPPAKTQTQTHSTKVHGSGKVSKAHVLASIAPLLANCSC